MVPQHPVAEREAATLQVDDVSSLHHVAIDSSVAALSNWPASSVDGVALPRQIVHTFRQRFADRDHRKRRTLRRVLNLFGGRGLGLRVEQQHRHLVGVDQVEHRGDIGGCRVVALLHGAGEAGRGAIRDTGIAQQVVRHRFGRDHRTRRVGLADLPLRCCDVVGLLAEFYCIGTVFVCVRRVDLGEPLRDLLGDGLGDAQVVEDVFVVAPFGAAQ